MTTERLTEFAELTGKQSDVLMWLAERTDEKSLDPGVICSGASFADKWNVFVNFHTARALRRAGLVVHPYIGTGYDGDNTSIALTPAGWSAIGQEAPRG